jgi:transcriptional regulator with XRE-family HTH domain
MTKGYTLYQLADKLGISASIVSAWERGTETPDEKQWQMLNTLLSVDSGVNLRTSMSSFTEGAPATATLTLNGKGDPEARIRRCGNQGSD